MNDLGSIMNLNNLGFINDLKRYLARSNEILKAYIIDIYILSKIVKIPIVLYNNYDNVIGIFDNGIQYLSNYINFNDKDKYIDNKQTINIKYNINNFSFTSNPSIISAIYLN